MPIIIGGSRVTDAGAVVLSDSDMPTALPLGDTLDDAPYTLSDGTRGLSITGATPSDISLTGTLRLTDSGGSPLAKRDALTAMLYRHLPVQFTYTSAGRQESFPVIIRAFVPTYIEENNVGYTLTLFRQVVNTVSAANVSSAPTSATQTAAYMDLLSRTAPSVGPLTQAAVTAAIAAKQQIPGGSPFNGH